jgi:hypothetical protein
MSIELLFLGSLEILEMLDCCFPEEAYTRVDAAVTKAKMAREYRMVKEVVSLMNKINQYY